MKFKGRNCLSSQGEAASGDVEAATSYPENLATSINEGGTLNNRFSVLMKQPSVGRRCHLGLSQLERRNQRLAQSFKGQADSSLTLRQLVTVSWSQWSVNVLKMSMSLKTYAKSTHPVLCAWNNKAWMTENLFTTWFTKYFKLNVETYYSEKKKKKIIFNAFYCSLTIHLTQELWWRWTMKLMCSGLLTHNIHSVSNGSRRHFSFQVLFSKKHILEGYSCHR